MTTDTTSPTPPDPDPHAAVAGLGDDTAATPPEPFPVTSQDDDEATMLWQEGLPPDAVILAPSVAATPMRQPENTWGLLVLAADVLGATDPDREGEVALFAGCWLPDRPQAAMCEGDLVLVLTAPDSESPDDEVDVEMLLAHGNRWMRVGEWEGMDTRWPWTVAVTAAAIMELHVEATEAAPVPTGATAGRPLRGWGGNGGLVDLLAAGLIHAGEEFVWDRPARGARHTARIRSDGTLVIADGRAYVNPSGPMTALGDKPQNGWKAWKRTSDGRTLGDLRAELRVGRGQTIQPRRRR
ncbi:restriction system modified-DNA reader domain-containing protein [Actinosynnema sp. NPDC004786]